MSYVEVGKENSTPIHLYYEGSRLRPAGGSDSRISAEQRILGKASSSPAPGRSIASSPTTAADSASPASPPPATTTTPSPTITATVAGAAPGRKTSAFSPASPTTKKLVNTGTTAPSSKNRARSFPPTGAVTSKVVLSVSISTTTSPAETASPGFFSHRPMMRFPPSCRASELPPVWPSTGSSPSVSSLLRRTG